MEKMENPGLFLNLDELKMLFSELKTHEDTLKPNVELILIKIEKILYDHLTIKEIELLSCSDEDFF
jgi:hypothetical protein